MADQPNDPTDHDDALDGNVDEAADASAEATDATDAPAKPADTGKADAPAEAVDGGKSASPTETAEPDVEAADNADSSTETADAGKTTSPAATSGADVEAACEADSSTDAIADAASPTGHADADAATAAVPPTRAPYRRQPVSTTGANLGWVIGYLLVFATLVAVGLAIHYRDAAASTPPHPCSQIDFDDPTPSRRQRALISDCCADGYSRAWQLCAPHCPDLPPNDLAGQRACCRDSNDRWDYCNLPCEPWPNEDGLFADQCCRNATGDWEPCPVPCDDLWYDDDGLFDAEEEFTRRRPAWCD
jgi:hypothetical protein